MDHAQFDWFNALNPYTAPESRSDHALYAHVISAKRYVLFNIGDMGSTSIANGCRCRSLSTPLRPRIATGPGWFLKDTPSLPLARIDLG